mgnify:CR=1 FL=1
MYDLGIIGGGPAGYVAAIRAAQLGAKVVLIEKESIGGTCLNRGCIPTKALVESASLFQRMKACQDYGIVQEGELRVDFRSIMARKDAIVQRLVGSVVELLRGHQVELIHGKGTVLTPNRLLVRDGSNGRQELECKRVIIATGAEGAAPALDGTSQAGVVGYRQILALSEQPESLVVIGASVVGMEFAAIFHNLGTKVTVLGRRTFLHSVDQQLARRYRAICARRGLQVEIGLELEGIRTLDDGKLKVDYVSAGKQKHVEGQVVLLAAGCCPTSEGIGLSECGICMDSRGFIQVDKRMRTAVPGVYAAGDVTGGLMLAHVAAHEGIVAAENALGREREMDYRVVPNCVFTDPEIASVGMTEASAKEAGVEAAVARFPLSANGRALTMCAEEGLVRLVHEKGSGRVLGMHIMAPHASELIMEGAVAIRAGVTVVELADTMHQHPTLSEAIMEAAMTAAHGEAVHYRHI